LLLSQLQIFNNNNVFYCVWKNIQNYKKQYPLLKDLDIYIDPKDSKKAFKLLKESGWIRVINPVANYSSIRHYYHFDANNFYHIHLYIGLRTGDSWLKNYYLPIEEFIIKNSYRDKNQILLLSDSTYYIIFSIRLFIKNSTYLGRFLYRKAKDKYEEEKYFVKKNLSSIKGLNLLDSEFIKFINFLKSEESVYIDIPNIQKAKSIAKNFNKFLLINKNTTLVRQIFSFLIRLCNKFIFKFKKILMGKGKIIVFYGCDGSGKSTMSDTIFNKLSLIIPTKKAHLGKPFCGSYIFNNFIYKSGNNNYLKYKKKKKNNNLFLHIFNTTLLSLLRLISAYFQIFRRNLGINVITDRWPANGYSTIDTPSIYKSDENNFIINLFNSLNLTIYKLIPNADLAIFLDVDLEKIIERNKNRINSEPEDFIRFRYKQIRSLEIKANKVIKYKNQKDLREATNDCLKIILLFMNN